MLTGKIVDRTKIDLKKYVLLLFLLLVFSKLRWTALGAYSWPPSISLEFQNSWEPLS
jgi:hypothetical protein